MFVPVNEKEMFPCKGTKSDDVWCAKPLGSTPWKNTINILTVHVHVVLHAIEIPVKIQQPHGLWRLTSSLVVKGLSVVEANQTSSLPINSLCDVKRSAAP